MGLADYLESLAGRLGRDGFGEKGRVEDLEWELVSLRCFILW